MSEDTQAATANGSSNNSGNEALLSALLKTVQRLESRTESIAENTKQTRDLVDGQSGVIRHLAERVSALEKTVQTSELTRDNTSNPFDGVFPHVQSNSNSLDEDGQGQRVSASKRKKPSVKITSPKEQATISPRANGVGLPLMGGRLSVFSDLQNSSTDLGNPNGSISITSGSQRTLLPAGSRRRLVTYAHKDRWNPTQRQSICMNNSGLAESDTCAMPCVPIQQEEEAITSPNQKELSISNPEFKGSGSNNKPKNPLKVSINDPATTPKKVPKSSSKKSLKGSNKRVKGELSLSDSESGRFSSGEFSDSEVRKVSVVSARSKNGTMDRRQSTRNRARSIANLPPTMMGMSVGMGMANSMAQSVAQNQSAMMMERSMAGSGNSKLSKSMVNGRGNAVEAHNREEKLKSINPDSFWVGLLDFGYIITAVVTIVMLVTLYHPRGTLDATKLPVPWFIGWEIALCLFSILFTVLQFRIRCRGRLSDWILEDELSVIKKIYMSRFFWVDLFLTVPFEFIFIGWFNAGFHYASAKHFLRYFRTLTLARSPNPLSPERTWFRFTVFCMTMLLIAHFAASGFWSAMADASLTYVDSLYWSVATITSVGYGDIVPQTQEQRVYATVIMLCGILMIATFTAFATQYLTSKDAITEETDKHKMMMTALLEHYRVPWSLSKEVIAVFPSVLNNNLLTHFRSSIEALPPFLRDQLTQYFNATQLRSVQMFKTLDESLLLELASKTHSTFVAAFDFVFREQEEADALYIVLRGVVEVTKEMDGMENVLATLRDGECFGEMGLLNGDRRSANVVAVVASELLVLEKIVFNELLESSEEFEAAIRSFAKQRNVALKKIITSDTNFDVDDNDAKEADDQQEDEGGDGISDTSPGGRANGEQERASLEDEDETSDRPRVSFMRDTDAE